MTIHVLTKMASVPWAIDEDALRVMMDVAARAPVDEAALDQWKSRTAPSRDALSVRSDAPLPGASRARLRDGVAIVPVSGPIFRYSNMMTDFSGATSLAAFAADLKMAADDSKVRAIMLEIDSPGGEVTGIAEAAQQVRAAAAQKPVVAYAEGMMASAAFQIGAAAREIVVAPTAQVGSLGVVVTRVDRAGADARTGIRRYEFISSQTPGKRPDPQTDEGRAALQTLADRTADEFLQDIAHSRGTSVAVLLESTSGGGMVIGRDAVERGLADRISGFEETLARLASGDAPADRRRGIVAVVQPIEEAAMAASSPTPTDQPESPSVIPLATAQPELGQPVTEPSDQAAAERQRAAAITRATRPGFQGIAAIAMEQGWSVDVFKALQDAAPAPAAQAADQLAQFKASFPPPVSVSPQGPDQVPETPDGRLRLAWDRDAAVRAEFGDFDTYKAFVNADRAGLVKTRNKG
jgi:signal peptide peptidase SppA